MQFHITNMGWPPLIYKVLSIVGTTELCKFLPEFSSKPLNHLPFLHIETRNLYFISLSSLHPHTERN